MKKKTKTLILSIVITLVLLLTFTITYAIFSYQETSNNNNQLIMGDIYMHYKENNQLILNNAMPQEGFKTLITGYNVNPIMAEQDASDITTELYACINLFQNDWGWGLDEGEDFESFCKGTGTQNGWTLQMYLDSDYFDEESYIELSSLNIIQEETLEYTGIKMNPEIKEQTVEYENELTACVNLVSPMKEWLDQGSTLETYCQGTGTMDGGYTFQVDIDDGIYNDSQFQEMLSLNIIQENGDSYIINPDMATQEVGEINELMTCISIFTSEGYEFDNGTTAESFCKGEGTYDGGITLKDEFEYAKDYVGYMTYIGNDLLENNIIIATVDLPYFEFTISGKNTYSEKDIYYDIKLDYGDPHETRNTRLEDNFLKFRLTEVNPDKTEKIIFDNKSYSSIENKRIHIETIKKNTMDEINKTYRLYMWIDEDVVIGNIDEDYTLEEWNDVFASVKINVTGDFNKKTLVMVDTIKSKIGTDGLVVINQYGGLYDESDPTQEIREYRYSGSDVNNYVFFDTDADGVKTDDEIWRIVGVFKDTVKDSNGEVILDANNNPTYEEKIKLVKNSALLNTILPSEYVINNTKYEIKARGPEEYNDAYWNLGHGDDSDWTTAGLQYYLNTEHDESATPANGYLSFIKQNSRNLISPTTYYLGNYVYNTTPLESYQNERDETNILDKNKPSLTSLVGLLYPSDLGYSASSEEWGIVLNEKRNTSWFNSFLNIDWGYWYLSPSVGGDWYKYRSVTYGELSNSTIGTEYPSHDYSYFFQADVLPVIHLVPDATIIDASGTLEDPYVVVIE